MRRTLLVVSLVLAVAVGMGPAVHAERAAGRVGLPSLEPLSDSELEELDGMGGNYLDSLPAELLEQLGQLENLEKLKLTLKSVHTRTDFNGSTGISDSAFQDARGLMALIQIAGNENVVDFDLHLNIFLGANFYGDFSGDFGGHWIDLSGLLGGSLP